MVGGPKKFTFERVLVGALTGTAAPVVSRAGPPGPSLPEYSTPTVPFGWREHVYEVAQHARGALLHAALFMPRACILSDADRRRRGQHGRPSRAAHDRLVRHVGVAGD